jgi:hypothetical protein
MTGRKEWAADDVLSAADLEGYLMDQAVTIWANSSARNSGILAPIEGQISYLQDTNIFQAYSGSAWVDQNSLGGTATYATNAGTAVYATNAGTAVGATRLNGLTIFTGASTPTANAVNDLWFN